MPIGINKYGHLYKATGTSYSNPHWVGLSNPNDVTTTTYLDVGVSPNYDVWAIRNDNNVDDKGHIDYWVSGSTFVKTIDMPTDVKAVSIAIDIHNVPWVVGDNNHLYKYRGIESTRDKPWHKLWKTRAYRAEISNGGGPNGEYWCVELDEGKSKVEWMNEIGVDYVNRIAIYNEGHEANVKCEHRNDIGTCVHHSGSQNSMKYFDCS